MPIYQVVILAIVQGLTEFLPISSSAHLALAPWLFGWKDPGLVFDIALHIGTLAAVIAYFFRDWVQIIAQGFGLHIGSDPELKRQPRLLWVLALATIPVGIVGLLFSEQAETTWRNPYLIGTMLIGVAIIMIAAEKMGHGEKHLGNVTNTDAAVVGIAQALAVVPGTSRSGITIAAGTLPQPRPRHCGPLFLPAFHSGHRGGCAERRPRSDEARRRSSRHAPAFHSWNCGQRSHRRVGNWAAPSVPASPRFVVLHLLPDCFWHNGNRSGHFLPLQRGMNILGPTRYARLNEAMAIVYLIAGLFVLLSLASYSYQDPSWDTVTGLARARNLTGPLGAHLADFLYQLIGLGAFAIPALILALGWRWLRSASIEAPLIKVFGSLVLLASACTAFSLGPQWKPIGGVLPAGGLAGGVIADYLILNLNITGAVLMTAGTGILSLYLISTFSMAKLAAWFEGPIAWCRLRLGALPPVA